MTEFGNGFGKCVFKGGFLGRGRHHVLLQSSRFMHTFSIGLGGFPGKGVVWLEIRHSG